MHFNIDPNVIIQALIIAMVVASVRTLWKTATRLDMHEKLDDLRFSYIDKKLTEHDERLNRVA